MMAGGRWQPPGLGLARAPEVGGDHFAHKDAREAVRDSAIAGTRDGLQHVGPGVGALQFVHVHLRALAHKSADAALRQLLPLPRACDLQQNIGR